MSLRTVHIIYICGADGVEFQDVVVEVEQSLANLWTANLCGVAQDAHLGRGAISVPHLAHPINNLGEVRIARRFAVASEGQHIRHNALLLEFLQLAFQSFHHLIGSRQRFLCAAFAIQSTLTIDAVEAAKLPTLWQQIDAKRDAQPTAVNRSEDGRIIDDGTHFPSYLFSRLVVWLFSCLGMLLLLVISLNDQRTNPLND